MTLVTIAAALIVAGVICTAGAAFWLIEIRVYFEPKVYDLGLILFGVGIAMLVAGLVMMVGASVYYWGWG